MLRLLRKSAGELPFANPFEQDAAVMIEDEAVPIYQAADEHKRRCVAEMCRRGRNANRHSIAADIIAGNLWGDDGGPKSYWHCLATVKPAPQPGRRGQWIATPGDWHFGETARWVWQDWGPEKPRR